MEWRQENSICQIKGNQSNHLGITDDGFLIIFSFCKPDLLHSTINNKEYKIIISTFKNFFSYFVKTNTKRFQTWWAHNLIKSLKELSHAALFTKINKQYIRYVSDCPVKIWRTLCSCVQQKVNTNVRGIINAVEENNKPNIFIHVRNYE